MIQDFAALYRLLEETTRTGEKVDAMADYLRRVDAADGAWAVHLLAGQKLKRLVSYQRLRHGVKPSRGSRHGCSRSRTKWSATSPRR